MARHAVEHPVVRTRLLEAARQLMLRDGFPATGVAEICAAAGVTKGSFFHYFAGVDEFAVRPRRCDPIGVYSLAGDVIHSTFSGSVTCTSLGLIPWRNSRQRSMAWAAAARLGAPT